MLEVLVLGLAQSPGNPKFSTLISFDTKAVGNSKRLRAAEPQLGSGESNQEGHGIAPPAAIQYGLPGLREYFNLKKPIIWGFRIVSPFRFQPGVRVSLSAPK